ncbi:RNA polymerase sigma factor, sigma-70 family [Filimonas lacunae]|uniref:RNA polymerase sigma factor, sigma-70 family n=1 Tax=Filimonas lacunae TaxID=477680 RepID=A0A173MPV8_9BACT|nr:sigma-70 family RNA polymerase sigma factor [Filimonas lacunae]BAV09682.1 RNA polymerase ECF-type sigma factor [Filimonas lacunae]SIS77181.1 RNA polymerase sigma factor, sigma-70 family [Filimonas lacunae]
MSSTSSIRQATFETAVIAYWDKLLGIAVAKTNEQDGFDLVQDVLLSAWEKWGELPKDESLEFYLLHALKLRIFNYYRSTDRYQQRLQKLEELLNHSVEQNDALAGEDLQAFREALVREAVATLSPNQQQLFTLRVQHQYSYQKIAAILHIAPGSARVLYARALEQIKTHIRTNPAASESILSAFVLFTIC